jgi:hypothetical protein
MGFMQILEKFRWGYAVAALVGVGLLLGAGITLKHRFDKPAQGTILHQPNLQSTSPTVKAAPTTFVGQAMTFIVPPGYRTVVALPKDSYLEQVSLISTDHSGKGANISLIREAVSNDSGLNYRLDHPELYKQVAEHVFAKQDGSEYTGYLTHDNLVAVVSFSSTQSLSLQQDYQQLVDSWQWR